MDTNKNLGSMFEAFAQKITTFTGSTSGFIIAFFLIVVWGFTGPIFHFSDTWQLVINTGTTIITFLMVFLIQRSQNKDSMAIHLKLNELVAAVKGASNRLIDAENLSEEELNLLGQYYKILVEKTSREANLKRTHSIEDAAGRHIEKMKDLEKEEKEHEEILKKENDKKEKKE